MKEGAARIIPQRFKVSHGTFLDRIEICKECDYFTPQERCILCGCFMNIKARLKRRKCPEGKWGPNYE